MKRFILAAAVAASLLGTPAAASAADTAAESAACPGCIQAIEEAIRSDQNPCLYGETYSECAFRIVRNAPDYALYLAEIYVNYAGQTVGDGIDTAKAICGQVIRTCGTL